MSKANSVVASIIQQSRQRAPVLDQIQYDITNVY